MFIFFIAEKRKPVKGLHDVSKYVSLLNYITQQSQVGAYKQAQPSLQ